MKVFTVILHPRCKLGGSFVFLFESVKPFKKCRLGSFFFLSMRSMFEMRDLFSVLLDECGQLSVRRMRVKSLCDRVYLSLIRDATAQILDHNWTDYARA